MVYRFAIRSLQEYGDVMKTPKNYFKKLAYSLISEKFIVFIVATVLLWYSKLDGLYWMFTAIGFISINLLQKVLVNNSDKIKIGKENQGNFE